MAPRGVAAAKGGFGPTSNHQWADVLVVGAGPAGTTAARLLATAGLKVVVLEEHGQVGSPVHCTGIVGREIFRDFDIPPRLVLSELRRFRVFSPGGVHFDIPDGASPSAYVLDRQALDVYLAARAVQAGALIECDARVSEVVETYDGVALRAQRMDGIQEFRGRLCVLASGAMSNLPYRCGIAPPRGFYKTVQAVYSIQSLCGAEIYLGSQVAHGSFGYAVATDGGAAKAGIICRGTAHHGYRRMLADPRLAGRVRKQLTHDTYRRIPMGASRRTVAGRIVAVGDAAGQAKTTTGGGIYYAMLCARLLCDAILASRRADGFWLPRLFQYEREWRRAIGMEIQAGLWMRGFFEQVTDEDVDRLVTLASSPDVVQVFEREWNFDFHRHLLLALARCPYLRRQAMRTAARTWRARRLLGFIFGAVDAYASA